VIWILGIWRAGAVGIGIVGSEIGEAALFACARLWVSERRQSGLHIKRFTQSGGA